MTTVKLLAKRNTQGYFMNLLITRLFEGYLTTEGDYSYGTLEAHFTDATDLYKGLQEATLYDADVFIAVGLPFWESQRGAVDELVLHGQFNLPHIYHFATYGDEYSQGGKWTSLVDEEKSPVGNLLGVASRMMDDTGFHYDYEAYMKENEDIIRLVDGYNSYTIETYEDFNSVDLVDFGDLMKETLPQVLANNDTLSDTLAQYRPVFKGLRTNRNQYIQQAIKRVTATVVNDHVVCFGYAERYHNEIAHTLIEFYKKHNYTKILVFVGKHTKGDDMFSVRSYGVDASVVANKLNRGKGKPTTATVFLGNSGKSTCLATISTLSEIL